MSDETSYTYFVDGHKHESKFPEICGATVRAKLATDQASYEIYLKTPDEYLGKLLQDHDCISLKTDPAPRFFSIPCASY